MKLMVSSSPHIVNKQSTTTIMRDVIIALIPALIAGIIYFGPRVLLVTGATVATSVLFEFLARKIMKRDNTIGDLSAAVTGLLLALNLPPEIPVWMAIIGSFIAIVVVKQMFGGIGQNFVNPALLARIVLLISFPQPMTTWAEPLAWLKGGADAITNATTGPTVDALSTATPLAALQSGSMELPKIADLFLGNVSGSIGETCALALIIGGIYLVWRKVISPVIPIVYVSTVALMCVFTGQNVLYHILSGGLLLGAIFMATDYTTSPMTTKGKIIYAIGCGLITSVIRFYGSLPEGVSYSIILMNILTPHIDRLTMKKPFGAVPSKRLDKKAND